LQVQIAGKKLEVGAALQERIAFGLESRISKYFNRTGEAFVTGAKPGWAFYVDCSIHLPSGVTLQAHGEGEDGYQAFEMALDKIETKAKKIAAHLMESSDADVEFANGEFTAQAFHKAEVAARRQSVGLSA
jgi:ribosomal subunit interface protein